MSQLPPNSLFSLANALGIAERPPQQHSLADLLSSYASTPAPTWVPTWPYVIKRFMTFAVNLALTDAQVADGITKFKGVVKTLNQAYWNSDSETDHAFYIGSWAKDTRIRPPRDVDLYFILPNEVYSSEVSPYWPAE